MALGPEAKVKVQVDKWIKDNIPEAYKFKPAGGLYSTTGVGDYILIYCGTPIMIEVKADESKTPTALQLLNLKSFQNAGGISAVLKGFQVDKLEVIKSMCEIRQLREFLNTPNSGSFASSDEYSVWFRMKEKCTNPNFSGYDVYGAKGIKIHDSWVDFKTFYSDMGPRPTLLHTLDRIDFTGNYEPGNCRWADKTLQANNKSNIKLYTYKGVSASISQLARQFSSIRPEIVISRVCRYGYTIDEALELPLYAGNKLRIGKNVTV